MKDDSRRFKTDFDGYLDEILRDCGDKAQVNVSGGYRGMGGGRVRTLPFHGQIVMDFKQKKKSR